MKMRIRELRKKNGLTLEQLAHMAGVSRSHLNEIELGRKVPNARRLEAIAHALGVKPGELFDAPDETAQFIIRYGRLDPKSRRLVNDLLDTLDPGEQSENA